MRPLPYPGTSAWKKEIQAAILGGKTHYKLSGTENAMDYIENAEGYKRGKPRFSASEKKNLQEARAFLISMGVEPKCEEN